MEKQIPFTGILSNSAEDNPGSHSIKQPELYSIFAFSISSPLSLTLFRVVADFFNWNRVKIRYCDGASFAGDGEHRVNFDVFVLLKIEIMLNHLIIVVQCVQ